MERKGKVVFANGVFDLLHEGHLALLRFAKGQGDWLVVGLNSDASVKRLKGPERPIHTEDQRKKALERLDFVDEVVIFSEKRTTRIVREIRPHVIVKGGEFADIEKVLRKNDRPPRNVKVAVAPILTDEKGEKISTTAIIKKMKEGAA